jgi:hypothetical protein
MCLATTFRTWPGWRKPGAARIASSATPARTGGRAAGTGYPACIRWGPAGYTPQISQRRAHASVPGGWQDPDRARAGAQKEEQLWGSR